MKPLRELFRAAVLKMLKKEGKIERKNEKGKEALAQDIIRNPFTLVKIRYIEKSCTVIYRSGMNHGKSKKSFELFGAEKFVPAIT